MKEERKGELFQFGGSILWALFPVITVLTYSSLPSLISLGWSTAISTIFFFVIVVARKRVHELFNWQLWKYIFGVVIFIGVLFYSLFYIGLTKTSPGNASIIALGEVFTSFLFFNIYKKEFFSGRYMLGSFLMILGAIIVLIKGYSGSHIGDMLILLAVFFPPIGNYFQQKARTIASSESILCSDYFCSSTAF